MLRMMCITAHPDDEAGNFGGSLRLYRDRGVETAVLCLTPGQAATHRGPATSDAELVAIRRKEFLASCQILGVNRGVVLDYADGQLHRLDVYSVVCEITRQMREFRPQVVLTYASDGGVTAHTDHALAGMFATLATQWSAQTNRYPDHFTQGLKPHRVQKLYYCTTNFFIPNRQPINPAPVTAVIDIGQHLETKIAAFHAHVTQAPLFPIFDGHVRPRGRVEMFHLSTSSALGPIAQETDLFAGVNDEE
jgi:LmbE family N-acetylglucosaminyl deacetylase